MDDQKNLLAALEQFRGRFNIRSTIHRSADTPAIEVARSPEMRLATAESRLRSCHLSEYDRRRQDYVARTAMAEIEVGRADLTRLSYSERLAIGEMPVRHRAAAIENDSYTQRKHLAQAKVVVSYATDLELRDEFFSRIPEGQQRQVADAMAGDYARRSEQARQDDQFERADWLEAREGEMAYRAEGYRLRDAGQQQDYERHRGHRFDVEQETDKARDAAFAHDHAFALEHEQAKERAAERAAQIEAMKGRFEAGAEVNGFASAATATASVQADNSIEEMSRGEFDAPKREMPRAGADQHQRQQRDAQQAAEHQAPEHQADSSQEQQRARGPAPDHSKVALETVFSHSELRAMQQRARQQEQGKDEPRYGTPEWRAERQKEFLEQPYQRQVKHWQDRGYKTEVDLASKRVLVRGDDNQLKFVDSGRKGIQFRTNDQEAAKLAMETMRERGHESVQYRPAAAATQDHRKEALALADRAGMKVENRQDVEKAAGIERQVDVHKWRAGEEREFKPAATTAQNQAEDEAAGGKKDDQKIGVAVGVVEDHNQSSLVAKDAADEQPEKVLGADTVQQHELADDLEPRGLSDVEQMVANANEAAEKHQRLKETLQPDLATLTAEEKDAYFRKIDNYQEGIFQARVEHSEYIDQILEPGEHEAMSPDGQRAMWRRHLEAYVQSRLDPEEADAVLHLEEHGLSPEHKAGLEQARDRWSSERRELLEEDQSAVQQVQADAPQTEEAVAEPQPQPQPQPQQQRPMSAIELRRARMAEQDQARGAAPDAERAKSATHWAEQSQAMEQQLLAEQQRQRNREQGLSQG